MPLYYIVNKAFRTWTGLNSGRRLLEQFWWFLKIIDQISEDGLKVILRISDHVLNFPEIAKTSEDFRGIRRCIDYNPATYHSQPIISISVSCLGSISAGSFPEQRLVIEPMSCYATPIGTPKNDRFPAVWLEVFSMHGMVSESLENSYKLRDVTYFWTCFLKSVHKSFPENKGMQKGFEPNGYSVLYSKKFWRL